MPKKYDEVEMATEGGQPSDTPEDRPSIAAPQENEDEEGQQTKPDKEGLLKVSDVKSKKSAVTGMSKMSQMSNAQRLTNTISQLSFKKVADNPD